MRIEKHLGEWAARNAPAQGPSRDNHTLSVMTIAYIRVLVGYVYIASAEHLRLSPLRRPVRAERQFQRPQVIRP
jgi:hypothetical protein